MRKLFIALAFAGFAMSMNAQETVPVQQYSVATNSFWSNWFVQAGADWSAWYSNEEHGLAHLRSSVAIPVLPSLSASGLPRVSDCAQKCRVSGAKRSPMTTTPVTA